MASAFAIAQGIWIGLGGLWMIRAFRANGSCNRAALAGAALHS